jgi:hypothetical protein
MSSSPGTRRCRRVSSAAHLRGLGDLIPHGHEFYTTTRLRPRRNDIRNTVSCIGSSMKRSK